jgi:two-component system sensor histidine kinase UhpB
LRSLVEGWSSSGGGQTVYRLTLAAGSDDGPDLPWPQDAARIEVPVDLALAIYRISQEALTNVARHAAAQRVLLALRWCPSAGFAGAAEIDWTVCDDGVGLPGDGSAARRGNGLTGMRERVWALGGELLVMPAESSPRAGARPGLRLQARFRIAGAGALGER